MLAEGCQPGFHSLRHAIKVLFWRFDHGWEKVSSFLGELIGKITEVHSCVELRDDVGIVSEMNDLKSNKN